jgi:hypothetical protein
MGWRHVGASHHRVRSTGLVDMGDALVFPDAGNGGAIQRAAKDTWLTKV